MVELPEQKHTPEELGEIRHANAKFQQVHHLNQQLLKDHAPLSVAEWLVILILLCIPVANICFCIYWAYFDKSNTTRSHFCIASLILILIGIVFKFVLGSAF